MFKNTFQSGFLSILYSIGSKPMQMWDKEVHKLLFLLASNSSIIRMCINYKNVL